MDVLAEQATSGAVGTIFSAPPVLGSPVFPAAGSRWPPCRVAPLPPAGHFYPPPCEATRPVFLPPEKAVEDPGAANRSPPLYPFPSESGPSSDPSFSLQVLFQL